MLETAKPQIKTEIENSLEARIALLNIQKRERQGILNANSRFAKKQKPQIKKLRYHRSQLGFKKAGKRSRSVFSQKISEANYNRGKL